MMHLLVLSTSPPTCGWLAAASLPIAVQTRRGRRLRSTRWGFYVTHQVDRCEAAGADDIVCEVGGEALDKT